MKKYLLFILLLIIPINIYAKEAKSLNDSSIYLVDSESTNELSDNSYDTYLTINANSNIQIISKKDIKYVYIMYEFKSINGKLKTTSETINLNKDGFIHELIKLQKASNGVTLTYDEEAIISEIHIYGEGSLPGDVQTWTRETTTDLMLFSTHSDDEVLFFGGIIPTYLNQGKKVHVVYLTKHIECKKPKQIRMHEVLDGLWTSGVRDYPTYGILPDQGARTKKHTKEEYDRILKLEKEQVIKDKMTEKQLIDFYVTTIRQYQPKVILGHDVYGEYGHGQHIYNTYLLKKAVVSSADKKYVIDGYDAYTIPKVYLHLYNIKNATVINLDTPLEKYNNRTAYQVTQEAFKKHISQQKTVYPAWLNGENNEYTKAADIKTYSPMYWGLYSSTVGNDVKKNDLFENIQ